MEKTPDKVSFKESMKLTIRGYKVWWKAYPKTLISSFVYTIFKTLTPYVIIYLSARIINEISGTGDSNKLFQLVLLTLISTALLSLLNAVLLRWKNYENAGLFHKRSKIYSQKLLSLDFCSIDNPHIHHLKSQIFQNDRWNWWGLGRLVLDFDTFIESIMTIIGALALTITLFILPVPESSSSLTILNNPLLIILIVVILLTITFIAPMFSNKAGSYWVKRASNAKMGNRYFNFFGFIAYEHLRALDIRIYRQDIICKNMLKKDMGFGPKSKLAQDARGPMGGYMALSAGVSQIFTGIVYIFICLKAWGGAFGIGSITQYVSSITALSKGVSLLISSLGNMKNNSFFLRTTFEFLDIPNNMYQGSLTVEKRSDGNYEIEFKNVSFKYPLQNTYALHNISMKFKVGQRLAVVGMNGSGKTTFIKLLCRLYDPTEGEILLNGIDIRKYNYYEYMSIFSVVFQDFNLLSFSLGENVAASIKYDHNKVESSLNDAGFGNRLSKMPLGLNTHLYKDFDEGGVEISGGEAQKIALARALYKDAPFIILDEPTAALDPIAEFEVYSKMNEIVGKKTAVFISHRLSSCRFCHDIAVFHEGKLIQRGSHDDLILDSKGKYHELWNAQAQYYTT